MSSEIYIHLKDAHRGILQMNNITVVVYVLRNRIQEGLKRYFILS